MTQADELRKYLKIDKHQLDDEIQCQPSLFNEAGEAAAMATAHRDFIKEQLAVVDATLDAEFRAKFQDEKCTEAQIKSKILTDPRHKKAFETYIKAKEAADILESVKEAFKQRNFMLRELANLYLASYYGDDSVTSTSRQDTAVYKQQRERLAKARTRD